MNASSTSSSPSLPRLVRIDYARLFAATGDRPILSNAAPRHWRLTLANERVSLTLDYLPNGKGALTPRKGQLVVDGKRRPSPENFYAVTREYHHPVDNDGTFLRDAATPMPASRDVDQAPPNVRQQYHNLVQQLPGREITVGFRDGDAWVIGVSSHRGDMRLFYTRTRYGNWIVDPVYALQVVVGGQDLSATAAKSITKAIRLLKSRSTAPVPAAGSTITGAAPAATTTSTQVRDTVVMRN
ncbi:hypothetical protein ACFY4C_37395 [Actinomadura viridis]|uniref:hypothetical protein n=1 Tax=Actinomadura viridis TaxID=58110 RepID=UPI003698524E